MSEMFENEAIAQALEIIDANLRGLHDRELMSTSEVFDLLLDMRSVLSGPDIDLAELDAAEPVASPS